MTSQVSKKGNLTPWQQVQIGFFCNACETTHQFFYTHKHKLSAMTMQSFYLLLTRFFKEIKKKVSSLWEETY